MIALTCRCGTTEEFLSNIVAYRAGWRLLGVYPACPDCVTHCDVRERKKLVALHGEDRVVSAETIMRLKHSCEGPMRTERKRKCQSAVTRIKVQVSEVTRRKQHVYNEGKSTSVEVQSIKLHVVTDGSAEDKAFFAATPSGNIEFGVVNANAAKPFDLGATFYVDFIPAE